jgi:hypothetical protein
VLEPTALLLADVAERFMECTAPARDAVIGIGGKYSCGASEPAVAAVISKYGVVTCPFDMACPKPPPMILPGAKLPIIAEPLILWEPDPITPLLDIALGSW